MKKALVLMTLTALALVGCGQFSNTEELEQDTSAHALLDYENNLIILPPR